MADDHVMLLQTIRDELEKFDRTFKDKLQMQDQAPSSATI